MAIWSKMVFRNLAWAITALALPSVLSSCASRTAGEAGEGGWGQPANGIQSRLSINPDVRLLNPADLPQLRLEFRNQGKEPMTFSLADVTLGADLEIDGVWYANDVLPQGDNAGGYATVAAGATSGGGRILPFRYRSRPGDAVFHPEITDNLQPGKHTVRARVLVSLQAPPANKFAVVSNRLTIEIRPRAKQSN